MRPAARVAWLAASPVLAAQAVWVGAQALRLPEPEGPRTGRTGAGRALRLLVLGDSSAAGVGAAHQTEALAPQIAESLAQSYDVTWHLCARNGAVASDAADLLQTAQDQTFDLAYVVFGVNDTKNLHSAARWRRDVEAVVTRLRKSHRVSGIAFAAVPPMGLFPLLPFPLRSFLGQRAARFDAILAEVADRMGCRHQPFAMDLDRAAMAEDGFHPGPSAYAAWARSAAEHLAHLVPPGTD